MYRRDVATGPGFGTGDLSQWSTLCDAGVEGVREFIQRFVC